MFAGDWAGLLAGFLVATSPEHMSRSNLGFADHDAIVIFLAAFGFYFLLRAIHEIGERRKFAEVSDMVAGFKTWFTDDRKSAGASVLAGGFFGALALTWKGFPYVFGVVLAYAGIQFLVNHWRGKDVMRPFFALATTLVVAALASMPYYASLGLMHFWNPSIFLLLALITLGVYFLATQEYPSILVLPGLLIVGLVFAAIMFLVVPDLAQALLHRFVYFRQTRLYTTIAEAHPSDFNSLAFSIGPIPFFMYLSGFGWLGYRVWTKTRPADMFFLVWAAVDLFMAISAVRFLSLAVPTFALLGATATVWLIRLMDLPSLVDRYRMAGGGWRGLRRATNIMHVVAIVFVGLLILAPNAFLAVDAAVPSNLENQRAQEARAAAFDDVTAQAREMGLGGETVSEFQSVVNGSRGADDFRSNLDDLQLRLGLEQSVVDEIYDAGKDEMSTVGTYSKRLGAFGQSFLPSGWHQALLHLRGLDNDVPETERPGFLSWWDYGHWSIAVGDHPAVADNFQNGYQLAGNFIVAQNESHALQLLGARQSQARALVDGDFEPVFTKDAYVATLTERGIGQFEAEQYYDAFRKQEYPFIEFSEDPEENLRISNEWVQELEAESQKPIRYFAVDNRMLPVDNPDTPRIESPSIYYAPATLAGKDPQSYVEQAVVDLDTGRQLSDEELRQIQADPNAQPNLGQRLFYHESFFNSMFYRAFMGLPVNEPVSQQGQTFPVPFQLNQFQTHYQSPEMLRGSDGPLTGTALSNEVAPAFGLTHFRLIDANPSVRTLEYFPGAVLEGQVTMNGEPLEGVRVTVFDDAGEIVLATNPTYFQRTSRGAEDLDVPHDSTLTGADGSYSL
ncbi:MAG: STT3 domain-containing protein, partial [Candidatus Thermoplasmatota archaeon]|nr:STT3 domain-containing protein [Candidatus Thermoplasmatota archaeon]